MTVSHHESDEPWQRRRTPDRKQQQIHIRYTNAHGVEAKAHGHAASETEQNIGYHTESFTAHNVTSGPTR